MNFDPTSIFISLIFGSVGFGFFRYGKKLGKPYFLISGLTLMIYPYFVSNLWLMVGIGVGLIVVPFVLRG